MKKTTIKVAGMTCEHCENRITKKLKEKEGVTHVKASFSTGFVDINYDENKVIENDFKELIEDIGYSYRGIKSKQKNKNTIKDVLPIFIIIVILFILISSTIGFNFLPNINETTPLVMLFVIGLLTSIHCVGMCGSINLAVSVGIDNKVSLKRPLLYNLGRIISYTLSGAIVGLIGSVFNFNTTLQYTLILITGILMFMMGLAMLGWLPEKLHKLLPKLSTNFKKNNKGPFIIGLLNGLMPCGPLQAMQLYALSTSSPILGALSMFLFSVGTVPLVFGFGFIFTKLKSKHNIIIQRISSVLVIMLSILMLIRALALAGININTIIEKINPIENYDNYVVAEIKDGYQYVEIQVNVKGYTPIIVQKDIPVVFNIKAKYVEGYSCTSSIRIPELNISQDLNNGDNYIKFTPTKKGNITYTCWMGMITSTIKVVDDINDYIKK